MRLRYLLPLGHGALDVALFLVLTVPIEFAHTYAGASPVANPFLANAQEGEGMQFDLERSTACFHPPNAFLHLAFGTLPAGLISGAYHPCPFFRKERLRNFFLIHEAAGMPLWFLIGLLLDRGVSNRHLGKRYLWCRALLTATLPIPFVPRLGGLLLLAFWFYVVAWTISRGIAFTYYRFVAPRAA